MKCCTFEYSHSPKNSFELYSFEVFPTNLYYIGWLACESFDLQMGKLSNFLDSLSHSKVRSGISWLLESERSD